MAAPFDLEALELSGSSRPDGGGRHDRPGIRRRGVVQRFGNGHVGLLDRYRSGKADPPVG